MNLTPRSGALFAVNVLFLIMWGFAGIGKLLSGMPSYFAGKFSSTFLTVFPGLQATFYVLALSELAAFVLALGALVRGEFLGARPLAWMRWMLMWSLVIFVKLAFGLWLTADYSSTVQMVTYFTGALVAFQFVESSVKVA